MNTRMPMDRRSFFHTAAVAAAIPLLFRGAVLGAETGKDRPEAEAGVAPAEDLMREHGVLRRVLLVYREAARLLATRDELPIEPLADSVRMVREFVENYHEKLEEDMLFPRFRNARTLTELIEVLARQHQAGRRLTDLEGRLATVSATKDANDRARLADVLGQFIRLYEPHAAREDTVVFPALHDIVSARDYDTLGEEFEEKEHRLFGEDGFQKMVDRVAGIEKQFGLYDLAQFTPKESGRVVPGGR